MRGLWSRSGWLAVSPAIFLLLWSGGFVPLRIGLNYADPLTYLALRYGCVVALMAIPAWFLRRHFPSEAKAWINVAAVGLLLQGGYFGFSYLSMGLGASGSTVALINSQQPIIVSLLAPLMAGERVKASHWVGLVLGVCGSILVITAQSTVSFTSPLSLGLAVFSLLSISAATLWEKRFGADAHPVIVNLIQYTVGFLLIGLLAVIFEPMRVEWNGALAGSLAFLVVFNSIIAVSLLLFMIRHGQAFRVSALFFLVPPATALCNLFFLNEPIAFWAWPGMLLAATGLYLVMRTRI